MDKQALRQKVKQMLKEMPAEKKSRIEKQIAKHLFLSKWWKESKTIGITISRPYEWDTATIIQQGWKEGKKMVVPKCEPSLFKLDFHELTDFSQLECVYHDLWEPISKETKQVEKSQIDLMIVPGLLFDKEGYRLGYGGGYFDRYLDGFSKETLALISEAQLVESIPIHHFDLPVKHIITENGICF